MKKILGLIGSPRKLGNSELMIKEISRNIPVPHELHLLRLSDFRILPCKGCYQCLFKKEKCVIQDDFNRVVKAMADADAFIVAAPAYFLGPNSALKQLLDRGLNFYSYAERLWGKPAVGIGIAGIEGLEGYTLLGIESFLKVILADNKKCLMVFGAMPGEIFLNEMNLKIAVDLASALFSPAAEKQEPCCPLCSGTTFRFTGLNRVHCMLCSNSGTIEMVEEFPKFKMENRFNMFFSKENALEHKKWLMGMKGRFMKQKNRLKEITLPYLKEGKWITPER
jgi:multimeric flavodoxin WrbA